MCLWRVGEGKENAGRVRMWRKERVGFAYTVETSYGVGWEGKRLGVRGMREVGGAVGRAVQEVGRYLEAKGEEGGGGGGVVGYCREVMEEIKREIEMGKDRNDIEIDSSSDEPPTITRKPNLSPSSKHPLKPQPQSFFSSLSPPHPTSPTK